MDFWINHGWILILVFLYLPRIAGIYVLSYYCWNTNQILVTIGIIYVTIVEFQACLAYLRKNNGVLVSWKRNKHG